MRQRVFVGQGFADGVGGLRGHGGGFGCTCGFAAFCGFVAWRSSRRQPARRPLTMVNDQMKQWMMTRIHKRDLPYSQQIVRSLLNSGRVEVPHSEIVKGECEFPYRCTYQPRFVESESFPIMQQSTLRCNAQFWLESGKLARSYSQIMPGQYQGEGLIVILYGVHQIMTLEKLHRD